MGYQSRYQKVIQNLVCLTGAGLMAALCYVGYVIFPAISVSGTKVHIGNAFVVLGALLLGGVYGGFAGAIGLSLADILSGYPASSPRTFICKLVIGLIVGLVAHVLMKISKKKTSEALGISVLSTVAGLGFNCLFEPALKYVWYTFLFIDASKSKSAIDALMAITAWTTLINAGINSVIAVILYMALRPALEKAKIPLPGISTSYSNK